MSKRYEYRKCTGLDLFYRIERKTGKVGCRTGMGTYWSPALASIEVLVSQTRVCKNPFKTPKPVPKPNRFKHLTARWFGEYRVQAGEGPDAPAEYRYRAGISWGPSLLGSTWRTLTGSPFPGQPAAARWDGYVRDEDGNVIS